MIKDCRKCTYDKMCWEVCRDCLGNIKCLDDCCKNCSHTEKCRNAEKEHIDMDKDCYRDIERRF